MYLATAVDVRTNSLRAVIASRDGIGMNKSAGGGGGGGEV